jgi:serine/threonine-protein phosphatase 2A regulatory subunit B'
VVRGRLGGLAVFWFNISLETPPSERPQLFIKKLAQCRVLFDFNDASAELKGKQIKAQTLHEMLEYITTQRGVITEHIYPEVVNMVSDFDGCLGR